VNSHQTTASGRSPDSVKGEVLKDTAYGHRRHSTYQHFSGQVATGIRVTTVDIISLLGFLALVIIGIAIILLTVRLIWMLIPAAIVAAIVFFLTFNLWYTGLPSW
jgi:hypothetical protein